MLGPVDYVRYKMDPRLAMVLGRLGETSLGQSLFERLRDIADTAEPAPTGEEAREALRAHLWLLDRAADGGIPLTAAGYLKPVDVKALAAVLPTMDDWIHTMSREVDAYPVLHFRESVQQSGLLRKYKGTLLLSRLGKACQQDPAALWNHLAIRLIPTKPAFAETASVLVLLHTGSTTDAELDTGEMAHTMTQLGWQHTNGGPVTGSDIQCVANELRDVLGNVGPHVGSRSERMPSPAALSLIRDALLTRAPLG